MYAILLGFFFLERLDVVTGKGTNIICMSRIKESFMKEAKSLYFNHDDKEEPKTQNNNGGEEDEIVIKKNLLTGAEEGLQTGSKNQLFRYTAMT
jgi:hypothetical protein